MKIMEPGYKVTNTMIFLYYLIFGMAFPNPTFFIFYNIVFSTYTV